ncbi:MAG: Ig-like domain-containing protein [Myxococcaceae bacterium]|nr:Ig-like domain-containing protein [Myxococcaceae bacterium]
MSRVVRHPLVALALFGAAALGACAPSPEAPARLVGLSVRAADSSLPRGRTTRVAAIARYSDGSAAVVTSEAEWSSSDDAVLSFDATGPRGQVRANAVGRARVSARFSGLEAATELSVTAHVVEGLRVERAAEGALPRGVAEQLRAVAVYSDGAQADVTSHATWQASTGAIALDPACAGRVVAKEEGRGQVRAWFEGASAEAALEVTAAVVAQIDVDPPSPSLAHGTDVALHATAVFTDGHTADVTGAAEWTVSDPSIIAVADGRLYGLAPGAATLSARFEQVVAKAQVTVTAAELEGLSLTPPLAVLARGAHVRFTAVGHFTDGSVEDLSAQAIWSSSSPDVAELVPQVRPGEVAANAVGEARIHARVDGFEAEAPVTVNPAQLVAMAVVPAAGSVAQGNTLAVKAIGTWSDSSTSDLTTQVAWTSSDPWIAAIDATGTLHGLAQGTVTLTATYQGLQPTADVTVTAPTVNAITLSGVVASAPRGTSFTLTAWGTFSDGHVEDVSAAAVWSSTNPFVASISNASATRGKVIALDLGEAELQATFQGVTGKTHVEVTPAVVDHLELLPGIVSAPLGATVTFSAKQIFTDGTAVPLTGLCEWSSSAPGVAVIDDLGNATLLGEGTTVITVSDGSHSTSGFLEVTPPVVTALTLSQSSLSLPLGASAALSLTAHWSDGTSQVVTGDATWTVADTERVQIVAPGILQTSAVGQTQVTATWNGLSATATVEVTPAVLVSVELSPAGAAIAVGQQLPLAATALYTDGHFEDVSAQANWASTDTSVATLVKDATGWKALGVAPGGVELRVYLNGLVGSGFFTVY